MAKNLITKHIIEAIVQPTLDKSEKEKLKVELNRVFSDATNIDFDTAETRASLQNLVKAFKTIFSSAGVTGIDFDELVKLPSADQFAKLGEMAAQQFWSAWDSVGKSKSVNVISTSDITRQVQTLQKRKLELQRQGDLDHKKIQKFESLANVSVGDLDELQPLKLEDDLDAQANKMMDNFYAALEVLDELEEGTKEYNGALVRAMKAVSNLYRMQETLYNNEDLLQDETLLSREYDDTALDKLTENVRKQYKQFFNRMYADYQKKEKRIKAELKNIESQLQSIQNSNPEILTEAKASEALKSLNEIEDAYTRILNKNKTINKPKSNKILSALDYEAGTQSLAVLSKGYNDSFSSNENWENQYQWLVKFVREYDAYAAKMQAETDSNKRSDMKERLRNYTPLYEQLKPMAVNAENMLRNILNMANNIPLVGMGGADVVSPEDVGEAEQIAEAEKKAADEATRKAQADKESAEAAEREKAAQEASTKAIQETVSTTLNQEASAHQTNAEAIQKETEAQEHLNQAKKGQSYSATVYHGSKTSLENATYDPTKGKGSHNLGSGLYYTPDLELASKYGKNILQSNIQLDNVFTLTKDFITDIDALYQAMGKIKPTDVSWDQIKRDLNTTMHISGKAQEFTQNMLKMGYQGMYSKGYGYADPNVEQLAVYDGKYHQGLTTQPYNEIVNGANTAKQAVDSLNESVAKTHQLNQETSSGAESGFVGVSPEELKAAQAEAESLRTELKNANERAVAAETSAEDERRMRVEFENDLGDEVGAKWAAEKRAEEAEAEVERLKQELVKVQTTPRDTSDGVETSNKGPWALENTLNTTIKGVLETISSNTASTAQALSSGINVTMPSIDFATQSTLNSVLLILNQIDTKIPAGMTVRGANTPQQNAQQKNLFDAKKESKFSSLSLWYEQLESTGKLTDDIRIKWEDLWNHLDAVSDDDSFRLWREELTQVQNAIQEIIIANKLVEDEGKASFQQLISVTKMYNKMAVAASSASTPELKTFYDKEANGLLVERQLLLNNLTLTQEQQAKLDELELERKRKINEIQVKQAGQANQTHNAQVEAESVRQLVKLYEQLGRAQAQQDAAEASRLRGEIKTERGKLSSVDFATNMKFRDAKEKGYNSESTRAENMALKEQETVLKTLVNLYQKLGEFKAKAENADEGMATWYSGEAKKIEAQIIAETQKLDMVTTAMQDSFDNAYAKGRDIVEADVLKSLYAADDADKAKAEKTRNADIEKLAQSYEKLGRMQAQFAQTGNLKTEHDIDTLEQIIDAEARRLGLTKDQIAALESKLRLAKVEEEKSLDAERREKNRAHYAKEEEKAQKEALRKQRKEDQDEARVGKAKSAINKARDTRTSLVALDNAPDDIVINKANELNDKLKELKVTYDQVKYSDGPVNPDTSDLLKQQTLEVDKLTKETNELIDQYNRLSGSNSKVMGVETTPTNNADELRRQLVEQVKVYTNGKAKIGEFDAATGKLSYTVQTGRREITSYTAELRSLDRQYVSTQGTTKKTEGFFQSILRKTKEIGAYFSGSSLIYKGVAEIRKGIQYVRDIDSALTDLKKVTDETEESYEKFLDTAAKTADKVGSTIQEVVSSTADWARLNI